MVLIAGFVEVVETQKKLYAAKPFEEVGIQVKNVQYLAESAWPFQVT